MAHSQPSIEMVKVNESYFNKYPELINIMDQFDEQKRTRRMFLYLKMHYKGNTVLVPLRKNLRTAVYKWGIVGHAVPNNSLPNAGIDYRCILIINDSSYLTNIPEHTINRAQRRILIADYEQIKKEVTDYIKDYVKQQSKGRLPKHTTGSNQRYKKTSLVNYHDELGLTIDEKEMSPS